MPIARLSFDHLPSFWVTCADAPRRRKGEWFGRGFRDIVRLPRHSSDSLGRLRGTLRCRVKVVKDLFRSANLGSTSCRWCETSRAGCKGPAVTGMWLCSSSAARGCPPDIVHPRVAMPRHSGNGHCYSEGGRWKCLAAGWAFWMGKLQKGPPSHSRSCPTQTWTPSFLRF